MKITSQGGKTFDPCPVGAHPAVCVDVTPITKRMTQFGEKEQFQVVFETNVKRNDGKMFCVYSKYLTPVFSEKSNLSKMLQQWIGRKLDDTSEFDTESLIGKSVTVVVAHNEDGEKIYANIAALLPHSGPAIIPTGEYIRVQDRDTAKTSSSATTLTVAPVVFPTFAPLDWKETKVHVGANAGVTLSELTTDQIMALVNKWVPTVRKLEGQDKILVDALMKAKNELDNLAF